MKKICPCLSIVKSPSNSYNFHRSTGKIKRPTNRNKVIKKKSKWKYQKNHYKMYYQILSSKPKELNRILKLKDEIENVNFSFETHNADQILDALVEFVNIVTQFYDKGKINYLSEKSTRTEFNELLELLVRRDPDVPYNYRNCSKPGETVTEKNLKLGVANKVANNTKGPFIKKYHGKTYQISIVMTSVSGWKKGKVTSLDKKIKYVDLNPLALLMNSCQKKLLKICDELINN